ncbi:hypothetical protein ACXZ1K_15680 [Pedobacter sp. PWIIR3]
MDKEELLIALSLPMHFQMVANLTRILDSREVDIRNLFELTFHKKKEVAFRAAWMLEYLMVNEPSAFADHIGLLFELLPRQKNQSSMRHYSKMISILTDKRVNSCYKEPLSKINLEPVIEVLFTWLIDNNVLVATKVHCMQSLANLSFRFSWIKEELLQTIHHLEATESIAFFARARVVKKTLSKHCASR